MSETKLPELLIFSFSYSTTPGLWLCSYYTTPTDRLHSAARASPSRQTKSQAGCSRGGRNPDS